MEIQKILQKKLEYIIYNFMLTQDKINELREEFDGRFGVFWGRKGTTTFGKMIEEPTTQIINIDSNEVKDWFLSKFETLLKEQREESYKELLMEQHKNELEGKGYDFYFSIRTKLDNLIKEDK